MDTAITILLRVGVVLSVTIIIAGTAITFVHHSDYFSSSPGATHFPNTISEVVMGVRGGSGPAIMMAGLLVLIAVSGYAYLQNRARQQAEANCSTNFRDTTPASSFERRFYPRASAFLNPIASNLKEPS